MLAHHDDTRGPKVTITDGEGLAAVSLCDPRIGYETTLALAEPTGPQCSGR